jgi:D-alanyl-D-alanine carboxypeptidase
MRRHDVNLGSCGRYCGSVGKSSKGTTSIVFEKLPAFCLIGGLLLSIAETAEAQRGNPVVQFEGQTIDEMIGAFMKEHRIPGMTLAIVQAPYIPRVVGYGLSDVEKGLLASPKTVWNVGQLTQAYTAVAVMQLVESEKLGIDDPVGKHVAGLPASWQPITLRQLMAHVSGVPDYTKQPAFQPARDYKAEELLALVQGAPLVFKPGTRMATSATDFFLLGLVVERASGMSYEAFVTKNQFERLGLKNTMFATGLARVGSDVKTTGGNHQRFLRERPYIDPAESATGYTQYRSCFHNYAILKAFA